MAGGLTISTLNDSSGVLATQNGMSGIAKAWIRYNGTANTITGSFNIASVTKNGTGDYTLNFSTALPDANYTVVLSMANIAAASIYCPRVIASTSEGLPTLQTTTQLRFMCSAGGGGSYFDAQTLYVAIFR